MNERDQNEPFGNPDGARADLADLLQDFVDFDGDPGYGALATRASDAKVRVIVGKLGAGKTVYLRRLQEYQGRQASVYADVPQQALKATEEVIRACQWFPPNLMLQKWSELWNRAILRSLATHLLRARGLQPWRQWLPEDFGQRFASLLGAFAAPRSPYDEVRQIIHQANHGRMLTAFLADPLWTDLEYVLGDVLYNLPPIFFYLDGVDEEFGSAPMYWLQCQLGLFDQVMNLLRHPRLGGRLHVVVCIRDVVMSSVFRSEHAPKYIDEPHVRLLTWDRTTLRVLLGHKLQGLSETCFMGDPAAGRSVRCWLGMEQIENLQRGVTEDVTDYLIRHTRLIPRDVVSLGNAICVETRRRKAEKETLLPQETLRRIVSRAARRFGDSQLAQCSNQVASDMMPDTAAKHEFTHVYTGDAAYVNAIQNELRSAIREIGVDRFSSDGIEWLQAFANEQWGSCTDLPSVLWQNGLLGYVDRSGRCIFYSLGDADQFHLPDSAQRYVFHPCVIDSVGIRGDGSEPVVPS